MSETDDARRRSQASDYPGTDVTLQQLLEAGVPWHLAQEAIASTALDRDERVQTHSEHRARRQMPPSP